MHCGCARCGAGTDMSDRAAAAVTGGETYQDIEAGRRVRRELEQIFVAKGVGGRADTATLARVQRLCVELRCAVNDGYVHEKSIHIVSWAGELFSGGKHRNWDCGPQPGATTLRVRIENALEYLASRLTKIEGARRADGTKAYGDSLTRRSVS